MILTRYYKTYLFFCFLMATLSSAAQDSITIRATADKNRIAIGERIQLSLEAIFPPNEPMRFFDIDSIAHFEILQRQKIDTLDDGGRIELKQVLILTSFDSGQWVIPSFLLPGHTVTDSIAVEVVFAPFDPNQAYHDIKDVINVEPEQPPKKKTWYWYAAAGALLLVVIIYLLTRKKRQPAAVTAIPVDAYKDAMQELEKLRKENPASKIFFTRLVDILRLYVLRRTGITSLQKTTDDLVVQLRTLKLDGMVFNSLAQSLRMSDFVKFAKYEPEDLDTKNAFNTVRQSIDLIEKSTVVKKTE
jgi:hypothetical protein